MGWSSADLLQQAVDDCTNPSGEIGDCAVFDIQSESDQTSCQLKSLPQALVKEQVTGIVGDSLPGDVSVQYGPLPATQTNPAPQTTTLEVPTVGYSPGTTATSSGSVLPGQVFKEKTSSSEDPAPSTTTDAVASPVASAAKPPLLAGAVGIESAPAVASSSDAPAVSTPTVASAAPTSFVAAAAPSPTASPETTAAPAAAPVEDGLPAVSTQYVTNGNVVSEIVWKQAQVYVTVSEDVTVTTTVQPSPTVQAVRMLRRGHGHEHAHVHRHLRHGRR